MKVRLTVLALGSLFTAWLTASYFGKCVAEDYPGLSSHEKLEPTEELREETPEADNQQLASNH